MILCMGLLKAIPEDLTRRLPWIWGQGRYRTSSRSPYRSWKPLTPLLIASFAFNPNNFVLIQLLTERGAGHHRRHPPARTTDLLVSHTYRIAFQGSGGQGPWSGQCHRHRYLPHRGCAGLAQPEIVQSRQATVRRLQHGNRTTQISQIPGVGNPPGDVGLPGTDHLPADHGHRHLVPVTATSRWGDHPHQSDPGSLEAGARNVHHQRRWQHHAAAVPGADLAVELHQGGGHHRPDDMVLSPPPVPTPSPVCGSVASPPSCRAC